MNFRYNAKACSVSLGIVFENNDNKIIRLVDSLLNMNIGVLDQIIAIDNCSDNLETLNYFKKINGISLMLIRNAMKMPLPYNRNQVFRQCHSDIVVFVDSDVEFIEPDFFEKTLEIMMHAETDIVCPIILSPNGHVQSFGLKKMFKLPYIFKFNYSLVDQQVDMIHGACFIVRKRLFEQIGGFDEFMKPYNFDEMDFAIRAKMNGFKIRAFTELRIRHYGGATTSRFSSPARAHLFIRHALRSIRRNYHGIRRVMIAFAFCSLALVRTLVDIDEYLGHFVILRSILWQITDDNAELLYIEDREHALKSHLCKGEIK